MDLFVERQYLEKISGGEREKFLNLYDVAFAPLFKYVSRRVDDREERDKILELTFLDALLQIERIPGDVTFLVWLYSLARPRVQSYLNKRGRQEAMYGVRKPEMGADAVEKVGRLFGKLSLEESEILRLKFFEELSDVDVLFVIGGEEEKIGSKVYRVYKRAHFLLFGETEQPQGVYFGELNGVLSRVRDLEEIEVSEPLKLRIKSELGSRINRRDFAIDVEEVEQGARPDPFEGAKGSDDPAKIFVEAVREMREEGEAMPFEEDREKYEKKERIIELFDRFKWIIALVPAVIFVFVLGVVVYSFLNFGKIQREAYTICEATVEFEGEFSYADKNLIHESFSDRVCEYYEGVSAIKFERGQEDVRVFVEKGTGNLEYGVKEKYDRWIIDYYAKVTDSNKKSREV
ncbi:hypothetical protein KJ632_02405 [Patescibacteria group bacterium]|nr:hypothetical protein [Patescibacteria group bacterium]